MPITDVVFDYCGVLLDWRPELTMEGKVDTSTMRRLLDHADPYGFWHYDLMSDLGWSEEQVLRDFARHHPHDVALNHAMQLYFANYTRAFAGMVDGMPELLRMLRERGYRLWGLTNFSTPFVTLAHSEFPALRLLLDTVVSSEVRCVKPDARIYEIAMERFGIDPAHAMFFDDKYENARAASESGMHGVQFLSADQADAGHTRVIRRIHAPSLCAGHIESVGPVRIHMGRGLSIWAGPDGNRRVEPAYFAKESRTRVTALCASLGIS